MFGYWLNLRMKAAGSMPPVGYNENNIVVQVNMGHHSKSLQFALQTASFHARQTTKALFTCFQEETENFGCIFGVRLRENSASKQLRMHVLKNYSQNLTVL